MNKPALSPLIGLLAALLLTQSIAAEENTPASQPDAQQQTLLFENGDLLFGQLESIHPEQGLFWRHPDALLPIQFTLDPLAEVRLESDPSAPPDSRPNCLVQLTNGDEISGTLVTLDEDQLVLETWFSGPISIPRKLIQSLIPVQSDLSTLFQGPNGLEGWTSWKNLRSIDDSGEWRYRQGAFYATRAASLARDLKIPDRAIIEFDVAWKPFLNIAIALYTDALHPINLPDKETEPPFGRFYSLRLTGFNVDLLGVSQFEPTRPFGDHRVPSIAQKNRAQFQVRVSKPEGLVYLFMDGALIRNWKDPNFIAEGTGIRLIHTGQGAVRVSNLRVSEWDGRLEQNQPRRVSNQDVASLLNGDTVLGSLQSIDAEKAVFNTANSELKILLNRIVQIDLAAQSRETAPNQPNSLQAELAPRGRITFQLEEWDAEKVSGINPNFGPFQFDPRAFARIQFNRDSKP